MATVTYFLLAPDKINNITVGRTSIDSNIKQMGSVYTLPIHTCIYINLCTVLYPQFMTLYCC